jgi:protein gp37
MLSTWQRLGLTLREGCGSVLPNVWLGVSVEDQKTADERIPLLLQTPAAVRWVSYEPALGPVDFANLRAGIEAIGPLDWIVCGGESGPGARPMHPAWARRVRDQCQAASVPFFFKQWGQYLPAGCDGAPGAGQRLNASDTPIKVGKKAAGRLLDGRTWDEFPGVSA